jgi:hypothetical protein
LGVRARLVVPGVTPEETVTVWLALVAEPCELLALTA